MRGHFTEEVELQRILLLMDVSSRRHRDLEVGQGKWKQTAGVQSDEDWPGGSGDMEKGCRTCWGLTISKADCGEEIVSVEKEAGMGEEKGFSRSTQSSGPLFIRQCGMECMAHSSAYSKARATVEYTVD